METCSKSIQRKRNETLSSQKLTSKEVNRRIFSTDIIARIRSYRKSRKACWQIFAQQVHQLNPIRNGNSLWISWWYKLRVSRATRRIKVKNQINCCTKYLVAQLPKPCQNWAPKRTYPRIKWRKANWLLRTSSRMLTQPSSKINPPSYLRSRLSPLAWVSKISISTIGNSCRSSIQFRLLTESLKTVLMVQIQW